MIIGSCGYGGSGSSVLTDLLREYDDVQVYDSFEFVTAYKVDGLEDLEYHLMHRYAKVESGDYAIRRFLKQSRCYMTPFINKPCDGKTFYNISREFIDSITQLSFTGTLTADVLSGHFVHDLFAFASKKILMPRIIEKIIKRKSYIWPCHTIYYSIEPENFYDAAKKYVNNILIAMGADLNRPICLDQPFEGNNPAQSFRFFDDPYAILIDRDPRDMYIQTRISKSPDGKFYPHSGNVDDFILYYKNMRKRRPDNPRVLEVRFEDFIYEYDDSVKKIENFLGLSNHSKPKEIFNPLQSVNNTQLVRMYPKYSLDIEKIAHELPEFIYPFENYENVKFDGRPFTGAARKIQKI